MTALCSCVKDLNPEYQTFFGLLLAGSAVTIAIEGMGELHMHTVTDADALSAVLTKPHLCTLGQPTACAPGRPKGAVDMMMDATDILCLSQRPARRATVLGGTASPC